MSNSAHYERLDDDLFPELQFGPGRQGIRARVLLPPGDPRVPAPARAKPLLVVFRLDEPAAPASPDLPLPGWLLEFERPDADGRLHHHRIALLPRPPDGNATQRARPDTGPPPIGKVIYRGAWWADLADLYGQGLLRAGMTLDVAYADQARARLVLV